jgi:hypothetical protein
MLPGQRRAEALMVTPCEVVRPLGVTPDPGTGADVAAAELVHLGRCKVQDAETQPRSSESGLSTVTVQQLQVHLPVGTGPYQRGDVVHVVDQLAEPRAVLRRLRVESVPTKTWQTAQRLPVEELT